MENYFKMNLPQSEIDAISNLGLAHMGDCVFEILCRGYLCAQGEKTVGQLHHDTIQMVKATSQAKFADKLLPLLTEERKPRVGLVGEILLKYHPDANNQVIRHIMEEGGEPVLTDLMDFFLYCLLDPVYLWRHMGGKAFPAFSNWLLIKRIESLRDAMRRALEGSRFLPVSRIADLARSVRGIVSTGNQAGEGWLLTAEMLELIDHGVGNVLCLQPFGCLPNHITGKGVLKELKRIRPHANLMAVDYDPGSSEANQLNRIKLFMTVAHSRIPQEAQGDHAPASLNESVAQLAGRLRDNLKGKLENTIGGSGNSGDEVTNLA